MKCNSKRLVALCLIASALTTASFYLVDAVYRVESQQTIGLRWARQVSEQASGLVYAAKARGERDPLGWTIAQLGQGDEHRFLRLAKAEARSGRMEESFSYDPSVGSLDYVRLLQPEDRVALHVRIQLPAYRFLGTQSRAASDVLVFGCFLVFFGLFYLPARFRSALLELKSQLTGWLSDMKSLIVFMGVHIRDTLRRSRQIETSVGQSRVALEELVREIDSLLCETAAAREQVVALGRESSRCEALALNLLLEVRSFGPEANGAFAAASELQRRNRGALRSGKSAGSSLGKAEQQLRRLRETLLASLEEQDKLLRTATEMDAEASKAAESLKRQSGLFKKAA